MTRCTSTTTEVVCYDVDGSKTQLFAHNQFDVNGVLYATIYALADGTPIDTQFGVVEPGPCGCCDNDIVEVINDSFCYRATVTVPGQFTAGDVLQKYNSTVVSKVTGLIDPDTSIVYWMNDNTDTLLSMSNRAGVVTFGTIPAVAQRVPCAAYVDPAPAVVVSSRKVYSLGKNYANGTFTPDYDPNGYGTSWLPPAIFGDLQSFTVTALKAGTPGSGNTVRVTAVGASLELFLVEGQTFTWSVAQDAYNRVEVLENGILVEALGNSAFNIAWTEQTV